MSLAEDFLKGIWKQNPVLRMVIGMCPTLAVTGMAVNGFAMGIATLSVLVASGLVVSLFRKLIPPKARIPIFIVIIATFVTIADMIFAAYYPDIHKVLGLYVPLIVVNCLILGRVEAFASKQGVFRSLIDALGMGIGFTLGLVMLASFREILGYGTIFGLSMLPFWQNTFTVMRGPAGAFIALGLLIAFLNKMRSLKAVKQND